MANVSVPLFPDRCSEHARRQPRASRPIPTHRSGEPRPFPMDLLLDYLRPADGLWRSNGQLQATDGAIPTFLELLGVGRSVAYQWARRGIGVFVADALAVKLGVHPVVIWHDWFSYTIDDEADEMDADIVELAS